MNVVASANGAQAALTGRSGDPVTINMAPAGQMQAQLGEPSMQMLLAQLAPVWNADIAQGAAAVDDVQAAPEESATEQALGEIEPVFLLELPAMQSLSKWPTEMVQREGVQRQALQHQPDVTPVGVAGMGSPWRLAQLAPAATQAPTTVEHSVGAPLAQAVDDPMPVVSELAVPALHVQAQARVSPDALRATSSEVLTPVASDAVPTHKGPQALVQALADRVQVQQVQGAQIATVRLDPPQMGSLEIRIRQDVSGIHVQMQASHGEVGRQLAAVVDSLRQELLARSPEASVTVSHSRSMTSGGQSDSHPHGQAWNDEPEIGQALQATDYSALA